MKSTGQLLERNVAGSANLIAYKFELYEELITGSFFVPNQLNKPCFTMLLLRLL